MLREPGDRLIARRVEQHAPAVEERDAVGVRQRERRMLLGEDDRRTDVERMLEEGLRALGIELRRRLVEQQQLRSERERRREAHTLQLAARELRDAAGGEVRRPDRVERVRHALRDLTRRRADVLEAERDLRLDAAEHDLVLGILEDGRDGAGQLGGPRAARVAARDLHPAFELPPWNHGTSPASARSTVDFPEPDGPSSSSTSPGSTDSVTSSSASPPSGYENESPVSDARATALPRRLRRSRRRRRRCRARATAAAAGACDPGARSPALPSPRRD